MRLIDMDELSVIKYKGTEGWPNTFDDGVLWILDKLDRLPTVDAVPVVRCRECKLHDNCSTEDVFKIAGLNDDRRFCGVGQRREDGDA